jgi:hypothetical protein
LELLLNLVWAGIGAALLLLWATPRLSHANARRSAAALLAVLCVVCILFPVISMTDDLNASPAEPETVKSKLAVLPHSLITSGSWMLVYDPHQAAFCHEVEAQPQFSPPAHAFLSFLLTRRPPPSLA